MFYVVITNNLNPNEASLIEADNLDRTKPTIVYD